MTRLTRIQFSLALLPLLTACQSQPTLAPVSSPNAADTSSQSSQSSNNITLQPNPTLTPALGNSPAPAANSAGSVQVVMPAVTSTVTPAKPATPASAAAAKPKPAASVAAKTSGGATLIPISSIRVPADFDYATSREVAVDIAVSNPNGKPYAKVMVAIYAPDASGLTPLIRGVTDASGHYRDLMRVANYLQALDVQVSGFGISNSRPVSIQNRQLLASFGPQAGQP